MSLDTLFSLMSDGRESTDSERARSTVPAWRRLSQRDDVRDSREADSDRYAMAEVDASGQVETVNETGRSRWGWRVNDYLEPHLLIALDALEEGVPDELPVIEGGLKMRAVARHDRPGWIIVGYEGRYEKGPEPEGFSFDRLIDDFPVPVLCITASGLGWYINAAAARTLATTPEAARGRPVLARMIHPEDRWRISDLMQMAGRDGHASTHIRSHDGPPARLHLTYGGPDEYYALFQPAETATSVPADHPGWDEEDGSVDSLYNSFLEQGPLGLFHLDRDGRVIFENHRLRSLVGEAVDKSWLGLPLGDISALDTEAVANLAATCADGKSRAFETALSGDGGAAYRHVRMHVSGIRHPGGSVMGAVVVVEDRTTEAEQQQELDVHRRSDRIEHMLREIATTSPDAAIFRDAGIRIFGEEFEADHVVLLGLSIGRDAFVELASHHRTEIRGEALTVARNDICDLERRVRESGIVDEWAEEGPCSMCDLLGTERTWVTPIHDNGQFAGLLIFGWSGDGISRSRRLQARRAARLANLFESLYSWIQIGARYRTTVAAIDDALFGFSFRSDESRQYHFSTNQLEHLIGRSAGSIATDAPGALSWINDIVVEDDRPLVRAHNKTLLAGHESRITYRILHTDGSVRWLREHAKPRKDATGMTAVSGILTDVSEQKAAEQVLLQAKKEAEASNRAKTAFIATMSHEIRTPLGAVNGYAQLLRHELEEIESQLGHDLPEQVHEFMEAISDRSGKLLALVKDLFDLSNLEAGRAEVHRRTVPIRPVLERAMDDIRSDLNQKGVSLSLECHGDPVCVDADPEHVEQIFQNLLSNAEKFTHSGSVSVRVGRENSMAVIEVVDTGVGISESYQEHLFDAFSQEEDWRNRTYEGTGLGLALTRRLLDLAGGRIEVNSQKGEGSAFRVYLPIHSPDSQARNSNGNA